MKKITVSEIKSIQSLRKNSEVVLSKINLKNLFLVDNLIITYDGKKLVISDLDKGNQIFDQSYEFEQIEKIVKNQHLLGIICFNLNAFFLVNLKNGSIYSYQCHLEKINDVISLQKSFITASNDLTIRVWQTMEGSERVLRHPLALKGHKGPINCLQKYHNFLISGSEDKTVVWWDKKQAWTSQKFNEKVTIIRSFILTSQILIGTEENQIYFIGIESVVRKKICFKGIMKLNEMAIPPKIQQIDQSFGIVVGATSILVMEINLIRLIHQIPIDYESSRVLELKCKQRFIFYSLQGVGLSCLKV